MQGEEQQPSAKALAGQARKAGRAAEKAAVADAALEAKEAAGEEGD